MKTVLIGTTAINRPILHRDNIPGWYNYINSLDKNKYNICWFINIDYIERLESNVQETQDNFSKLITDIPLFFVNDNNTKTGNFLNACKRVSSSIEKYVIDNNLNKKDVYIFWLEDDWKLNPQNIHLERLIEQYMSNLTYINLTFIRNNYIHALAPSIINYQLWSQLHLEAWKQQKEHIDPEHCVGLYYKKTFGEYDDIINITLINKYKKHNKNFFNSKFLTYKNSYYTYDILDQNNIILDKYINNSIVKKLIKDKITFIRLTSSLCIDGGNYGRNFMKEYNIKKCKVQNKETQDFYK